ncbi:hypothetical protein [Methylobacterium sp. 10]|uniref:hypothetical protein n=1 Tax=Methylobacterium sp. 10 TaxID=1101191 RepID=UPI000484AD47|nr:hypothetical protein [Methylobacterium sp. 10]
MSNHLCLDPNDPYAQSEVLVFFEGRYPDIRLLSVIDGNDDEILSDLVHEQQRDLIREIAAFYTSGGDAPIVVA